jgi:hypothetical protein
MRDFVATLGMTRIWSRMAIFLNIEKLGSKWICSFGLIGKGKDGFSKSGGGNTKFTLQSERQILIGQCGG